jgi:hypothetical protein
MAPFCARLLWPPAPQLIIGALDKSKVKDFVELDRAFDPGDLTRS